EKRRRELSLRHRDAVLVSAHTGEGIETLIERIEHEFARTLRDVELLIPYGEGTHLAELHELAGDLEREETPDGVRVGARLRARADRPGVPGGAPGAAAEHGPGRAIRGARGRPDRAARGGEGRVAGDRRGRRAFGLRARRRRLRLERGLTLSCPRRGRARARR